MLSILKVISFFTLKSMALVFVEFTFSPNFLISFRRLVAWLARLLAILLNLFLAYFFLSFSCCHVFHTAQSFANWLMFVFLLSLFYVVYCYVEKCRGYYCPLWGSVNLRLG